MIQKILTLCLLFVSAVSIATAQTNKVTAPKKEDPQPTVIDPGAPGKAPSDAIVLFDGKDLSMFRGERKPEPGWKIDNGVMESTPPGGIFSKEEFADCQVHVEFAAPSNVKGNDQGRGNSGVYLMGRYEIQILDNYENKTYPNGQCGAMYGHHVPLVNACRKPGEWQTYDIIFHPPKKRVDGTVKAGSFTVFHNGVLIQDNVPVTGEGTAASPLRGIVEKGPLYLQDHGNPVRFRNVWVRKLASVSEVTSSGKDTASVSQRTSTGMITGKVTLKGTPPAESVNDLLVADVSCGKFHTTPPTTHHWVVGAKGELANVVVMLRGMDGKSKGASAAPAVLDQKNCQYVPQILAVQTGQKITVKNSDPLMHNVHSLPIVTGNNEGNVGMMERSPDLSLSFPRAENFLKFKCDVHPWMFAWVTVVDHPYFAVTARDGSFTIKDVPPGKYKIAAYHRKAASTGMEREVEVTADGGMSNFELSVPSTN